MGLRTEVLGLARCGLGPGAAAPERVVVHFARNDTGAGGGSSRFRFRTLGDAAPLRSAFEAEGFAWRCCCATS